MNLTGLELLQKLETDGILPEDFSQVRDQYVLWAAREDAAALRERLRAHNWLTAYQVASIEAEAWDDLTLGSYRLLECLAEGRSALRRGEHRHLRHPVVIRMIPQPASAFAELARRLQKLRALGEPTLSAPFDIGRGRDDTTFVVAPHLAGHDLRELVERSGPLPLDRVAACHLPIARALLKAHAAGLTHGALKPSKIRTDEQGQVVLVETAVAGSSPSADRGADVYGLAACLHWSLTGQTAPGASAACVRTDAPRDLAAAIERALRGQASDLTEIESALSALRISSGGERAANATQVQQRLLIVDDQPFIRSFCRVALEQQGYACDEADDGPAALRLFGSRRYDMVLLDIDMPGMSGWDVCRALRSQQARPHLKVLLFSGRASPDDLAQMMLAGADDYLTKPFSPVQLSSRIQAALQLQQAQERMDRLNRDLLTVNHELEKHLQDRAGDLIEARNALVLALAKLAESRDNDTGAHLQRLQVYARRLAQEALHAPAFAGQLDQHFVDMIACCAPLHDIGKVGLPDDILRKPGALTAEERRLMQAHTLMGSNTLQEVARRHGFALAFLRMSIDIARHHHERFDGNGYPDRLKGTAIPLAARIVTICDVYDALRSPRIYKPALSHPNVVEQIVAGAGTHFDPALVDCFRSCAEDFARIAAELSD